LIWSYCSLNSLPSRLSHSISDGVNGRGAKEVACLGFGEGVEAEAEVLSPVLVEGDAMLLQQIVKGFGTQRKDLAPPARAQRRRQNDPTASALDMAAQIRQRAAEPDMIIDQEIRLPGLHGPLEGRLEDPAMKAARARVANRVRLDDLGRHARHGKAQASRQLVPHGVGDQVDAGGLDGANGMTIGRRAPSASRILATAVSDRSAETSPKAPSRAPAFAAA